MKIETNSLKLIELTINKSASHVLTLLIENENLYIV